MISRLYGCKIWTSFESPFVPGWMIGYNGSHVGILIPTIRMIVKTYNIYMYNWNLSIWWTNHLSGNNKGGGLVGTKPSNDNNHSFECLYSMFTNHHICTLCWRLELFKMHVEIQIYLNPSCTLHGSHVTKAILNWKPYWVVYGKVHLLSLSEKQLIKYKITPLWPIIVVVLEGCNKNVFKIL